MLLVGEGLKYPRIVLVTELDNQCWSKLGFGKTREIVSGIVADYLKETGRASSMVYQNQIGSQAL